MPYTLETLVKQLESYNPELTKAKDIKSTLLGLMKEDPQPEKEECLQRIREELPVETVMDRDILSGPATIYRILRDYIVLNDHEYEKDPTDMKVSAGLAYSFYDTPEEQNHSRGVTNSLKMTQTPTQTQPQQQPRQTFNYTPTQQPKEVPKETPTEDRSSNYQHVPEEENERRKQQNEDNRNRNFIIDVDGSRKNDDDRRVAHNMSQRFKHSDDKFSAQTGQKIEEFFTNYEIAANDYKLTEEQKLKFLHNLFGGQARRYYTDQASLERTYIGAKCVMLDEFNSRTKQESTRLYLQSLTLKKVMEKHSIDEPKALERIWEEITQYAPSCPPEYRSDRVMVEYLSDALRGNDWAENSLDNAYSNDWSFNKLYTSLTGAWYQKTRHRIKTSSQPSSSGSDPSDLILYEGQRMYGAPRGKRNKQNNGKPFKKSKGPCWNCGEPGHFHYECPKKKNMTKTVHSALKNNPRSANKILFQLCQLHDSVESESDEDPFDNISDEEKEESTAHVVQAIKESDKKHPDNHPPNDLNPWDF